MLSDVAPSHRSTRLIFLLARTAKWLELGLRWDSFHPVDIGLS